MEIDYKYEERFLQEYLVSLRLFNPILYLKINRTGKLNAMIGELFAIKEPDFYLAGYYANLGLSALSKFVENSAHLSKEQIEQIKRHPTLSYEFLFQKGLNKTADYVYYHHELPDGSGYNGIDNYPKESAYINIADTFEGLISPKPYRPPHTFREAMNLTLKPYRDGMLVSKEEVKEMEILLYEFYNKVLESI
jgi:HD-GYP domain-containing protein (c-di-GMP phosphodiesterase class II)